MNLYRTYLLFILLAITCCECVKKPTYPSEPVIEYQGLLKYGNATKPDSIKIILSFTDNEGDIGSATNDTSVFKTGNLVMVYYYWDDVTKQWLAYDRTTPPLPPFDTLTYYYRVPVVLPKGDKSEPMKGMIYAKQSPFFKIHNRIKYKIYLYDLAKHKSNVVETPALDF